MLPIAQQIIRPRLRPLYRRAIAAAAVVAVALASAAAYDAGAAMTAVGRRPLVIASGVTEQLPTGDWLTSAGGIATNATTPAAGDVQTDTATIGTTLKVGALVGTTQVSTTTGTLNDFTLGASTTVLRWNGASNTTITGFTGGVDGRMLIIQNPSTKTLTLTNQSGSSASNQLLLLAGITAGLVGNNSSATFVYDGTSSLWRMTALTSTQIDAGWTFKTNLTGQAAVIGTSIKGSTGIATDGTGAHYKAIISSALSVSSCGSSPNPTVAGTDAAGTITIGGTGAGCTITFTTAYTNAPACIVQFESSAQAYSYTSSTTALTITSASSAGLKFDWVCFGSV